jgi:cystathionine beta-lyase/cystathionine gamma-synthase
MSKNWTPPISVLESGVRGLGIDDVSDDTKLVTSRRHVTINYGTPVAQPIVHSSTYRVSSVQEYQDVYNTGGYMYVRYNSPTCEAAEIAINLLEGGAGSLVFGSGMAAITTALQGFLKAGDHVVACNPLYGGTHEFLTKILPQYNVEVTMIDGYEAEQYAKAVRPNTKVLYGETPSNPKLFVTDLEKFGALGQSLRSKGVVTMVDTTFASPYLIKPIKYGVDIVIHSATKYLGGHSDLCAGVVTTRALDQWQKLVVLRRVYGGILSPFEASLLLRGLRTLHVRVPRQCTTAQRIAEYLEAHPGVESVHYPGLPSHPAHEIAKRQMKMFGAMIAFDIKGGMEPARKFVEGLKISVLAVSLGGVESLVEHPATMSHGPLVMSVEERRKTHISDGQIRFSVGLEDPDDLIADIKQSLLKATGH